MDGNDDRSRDDRPAPFVAPDCDLSGYDWFPLKHKRLLRSAWWLRASDRAKALNVELWCAAYQETPAASLPDDDLALSDMVGFGRRDLSAWLAVKAEVMDPWTLCSDGRWYHATLAEVATEAWTSRQALIHQRELDRERKRAQRSSVGQGDVSDGCPSDMAVTSDGRSSDAVRTGGGNPAENALKGQDRKGKGEADASPPDARQRAEEGGGGGILAGWSGVRELYASTVVRGRGSPMLARSAWLQLADADRRALPDAIRRFAEARPWGSNGPPALQKFIADDVWRDFVSGTSVISIVWSGPDDLRSAVVDECGEPFARSWLDPATWMAGASTPTLTALTPSAAGRLRAVEALRDVAIQDPILPRRQA